MPKKDELVKFWKESGTIDDERILKAFLDVPREKFIPKEYIGEAYSDHPLPIGFGQSISQPTTVMLMIKYLDLKDDHVVLEVGTGSGYNAALMSKLCKLVYSVERVKGLCAFARKNLNGAMIGNVEVIHSDGSKGFANKAPYDRIIITAATPRIPPPLFEQLKVGGVIVAPVGSIYSQDMLKVTKTKTGYKEEILGSFMFVPLKGEYGFP